MHGKTYWRVCLAGQFGTFIWRVFISNEKDMLLSKKEKRKVMKCIIANL